VTTPEQQWAYAVEFPLQNDPPAAGGILRVKLRVHEGEIGLGLLEPDGKAYQQEIHVSTNDKREAIEFVLPEKAARGSLMVRNAASTGRSRADVEIAGCEVVSGTEIVIDLNAFRPFRPWSGWVPAGFFTDWTGLKTRADVWLSDLAQYNEDRFEEHGLPLGDEHTLDWAQLVRAVVDSKDTFRMAALGAGWGRWLAAGGALAAQLQRDYRVLGVEAEPQHFEWMLRHFRDNNIPESCYIAVNEAAAGKPGDCWFEVGNSRAWYGQKLHSADDKSEGVQLRRTKAITIDRVLLLLSPLDYMHMDIQGVELDFLSYRPQLLDAHVRVVNVGTHSGEVEDGLRKLFGHLGWECLYDVRLGAKHWLRIGTEIVPSVEFGDGVQIWRNPRRLLKGVRYRSKEN
jgi:FkbM family methyltransferase